MGVKLQNRKYLLQSQFAWNEKIYLLLHSLGERISFGGGISALIPKWFITSRKAFNHLIENGYVLKKHGSLNTVDVGINGHNYSISLRRNSSDVLVFDQVLLEKEYQVVVDLLKENNMRCDTIVDAGANIGLTSLYLKSIFPKSEIYAIEPNKENFKILVKNIEDNQIENSRLSDKAIWNKETKLIPVTFRDGLDWSFSLEESNGEETSNEYFETTTIPTILRETGWQTIDLLKIDIEGGEAKLFEDPEEVKQWLSKVQAIVIEIHDELGVRPKILSILETSGFSLFDHGEHTVGLRI